MTLELTLDYRLRWNDFDRYGRITPASVLDICQDIATLQAEDMGIGRDDMLKKGVFWALVRMKYEVLRQPSREAVSVRTWPHTPTKFSFLRDFEFRDAEGELLVRATSEWVLVDLETRKFARMGDHYDGPDGFSEDRAFEEKPKKARPVKEANRPICKITPRSTDIDINGHVNNARYPMLVMDAVQLGPDRRIRTFQLDYRQEVLPDSELALNVLDEGAEIDVSGIREDGGIAFNCKMEME